MLFLRAWMKMNTFTREQLLIPWENNQDKDIPPMFITTYSRANPNSKELFFKHWPYIGRPSATRELEKQAFMITYRKLPSLKYMLIRAKISQPRTTPKKGHKRPNTCKYCKKFPNQGKSKNLNNNKSYNTITKGTYQSNNLIYCLECNWYHSIICRTNKKLNHR